MSQQPPFQANGIPPQMRSPHFNGLNNSANSSRDPSPPTRLSQIPQSQLPPSLRGSTSTPPVSQINQKMGQLSVNNSLIPNSPISVSESVQTSQRGVNNIVSSPFNGNGNASNQFQGKSNSPYSYTPTPASKLTNQFPPPTISKSSSQFRPPGTNQSPSQFPPSTTNQSASQFPPSTTSQTLSPFPQSTTQIAPTTSQPTIQQPTTSQSKFAPLSNQGLPQVPPPTSQPAVQFRPSMTQPAPQFPPQTSQPAVQFPPSMTQPASQFPPPTSQPAVQFPPSMTQPASQFPPPTSQPAVQFPPSMTQPASQFPPPTSQPSVQFPPSMTQPASQFTPPTSQAPPQIPTTLGQGSPQFPPPINRTAPFPQYPPPVSQAPPQFYPKNQTVPPQFPPTNQYTPTQVPPQSRMSAYPSPTTTRYPTQPPQQAYPQQVQTRYPTQPLNQPQAVTQTGFNRIWGGEHIDLLQHSNILPPTKLVPPKVYLGQENLDTANCNSEVFRCTITRIPESSALLQKSRLPLGVLIHPFKDLTNLPVIQCNVIVRCRTCRTYINPFVYFLDTKRWKCNLCYRINDLPDEFQYDPVSKSYGDPSRRPEIKSSTIEYIAPAEYMLRPPQPAVYLFLLDISRLAIESGYLTNFTSVLSEELKNLPGDARTQFGVIAYDSAVHYFSFSEDQTRPHEMIILDIDDIFLPQPDNLLVNLKDRMDLICDFLTELPTKYQNSFDGNSALGAALQAAHKLIGATGGRVTVFQASLPNVGPGALTSRENPSERASSDVQHLNPANDFYKRLALECSGQQIAVDLFIINSQYVDIATISGISRFSGGCIYHFPLFKNTNHRLSEGLERSFRRYLTRKIGFEAVMRIRCTRGLSIHTFHGNFFVRSTDLLSLPNVNPDAGFGMQVSIDENLSDVQTVCFQAALLYTSSKGERRIRVHTLCLPVCGTLQDVINSADQQCIIGILSKMAVDRSMQSSVSDAREAFINVAIDILSSYKLVNSLSASNGLLAPNCLKLLPLYISALLKYIAFRIGVSTRLDDRVKAMIDMKTKPLYQLIQIIYPDLYPVHNLDEQQVIINAEEEQVPQPPHLQLTARCLDSSGAFLMDKGEHMILLVGPGVNPTFLQQVLGVSDYTAIAEDMYELPVLDNPHNQRLHQFISHLNDDKPFVATLHIIRDNSPARVEFYERLIEDRVENALSYHEFLQHLRTQVK